MSDLSTIIVEGYRYTGDDVDLSGNDLWRFALDQRAFGPRQLVVVTARGDGALLGLAHCELTEPPEFALECCLDTLDDGAAAAVAYSDEPVSAETPLGLRGRLDTARIAAREFGVHLVDWIMCDPIQMRSMSITLEAYNPWWEATDGGPHTATPPQQAASRKHAPHGLRRSRRKPGGR